MHPGPAPRRSFCFSLPLCLCFSLLLSAILVGCGDEEDSGGHANTGLFSDTSNPSNGDVSSDTQTPDTSNTDTGPGDTGPGDTGSGDTGPGDTGPGDTGPGDTGPGDTGPGDTDDPDVIIPPAPERSCLTEITYNGGSGAGSVTVSGDFNAWDPLFTPMTFVDGLWRVEVSLPVGQYAHKFVIDGEYEGEPPSNVYTQWDGGFENRSLRVGDCQLPSWEVLDVEISPSGLLEGSIQFYRANGGPDLDPNSVNFTIGDLPIDADIDVESGRITFSYQAPNHGKYSLHLQARDLNGDAAEHPLYLPLWYEAEEFTWQDATLYLIFTDRFLDSDDVDQRIPGVEERANYLGGDFRGIITKIEEGYFEDMGINAIWLSPIYDNPEVGYPDKRDGAKFMSGFHGYWPISLDPEPRYGDIDTPARDRLRELTATAHKHGIRILFDLALNHVHEDHPYCSEPGDWCALTCQCGSDGCGWDPSERGLDCQFDSFLPDLSYRNPQIVERVLSDTLDMIDEYDLDGLRIDAARHMDHVIMRTLRLTLRERIEDVGGAAYYMVGETFTDDRSQIMQYVSDSELHGQFDFAMRSAIRYVFGPNNGPFTALDDAAATSESPSGYGDAVRWMSPFFGNHDIDRFATVLSQNDDGPWGNTVDRMAAGPDDVVTEWDIINRMSMAYAFLLSYKGIPLLYYGDEIGIAGSQDPDNRRMMMWDHNANQRELLSRVQLLGQARRDLTPLRRGERRELWRDDTLYVYARTLEAGNAVIIVMNKGGQRAESVQIPPELGLDGMTLQSYTNANKTLTVTGGTINIDLGSWEYQMFYPAP